MTKEFVDPCEYNSKEQRTAYPGEEHSEAEWLLGYKGQWRLCSKCAALPEFSHFKLRKKIKP